MNETTTSGSHTVANTAKPPVDDRRLRREVDLTNQHTNRAVLVDGPDIMIRAVGARPCPVGGAR
ncbi:hypothetical protein ACWDNI_12135 [Nocardia niigatensis]